MGYKRLLVCLLLALAGCTTAQETTRQVLDTSGDVTNASWNKLRDVVGIGRTKEKKENVQPRYCYRTLQDVLCYPTPIAGQEYRLTGYQEVNGKTGYVLPAAHPAPDDAAAVFPSARKPMVANALSPAAPKTPGDPKKQLKEVIFDPAELEPKQLVPDKGQ